MKTTMYRKNLIAIAVGSLLSLGMATNAMALPQFQVDPNMDNNHTDAFYATSISGSSSERLTANVIDNTLVATFGYLTFTGFTNDGPVGNDVGPAFGSVFSTGINGDYQLYLTFNLVAKLTSGSLGGAGSQYSLESLNFEVWRDNLSTLTNFTAATVGAEAAVTGNGDDIKLGSGSLIFGSAALTNGVFGSTVGAALNSKTTYTNTTDGDKYFFDPSPFYNISFNAFNNTGTGVTSDGTHIAINSAAGVVDFNRVPEPETLALMGIGLLGLGVSLRKRKAA
ncbi:Flocculation-associated PEP-CTERM protein PepA [Candidatus Nitrotoga sp. BS]|uniref:flocculation-associated PEP-CTERM protein PepA n=1 Tax=Candidatus Nitrotoga sp. BS TaxID=2890408 RepID=UPI001EF16AA8|nr:flocculation-associated PEP-CTERM protein PepA [Candidatus Nitrotoga sp. BS]CAH1189420.1 Flocculation-associated PEP-CTERM protein PepA [Candidatus Nitrotoga sp. BS]